MITNTEVAHNFFYCVDQYKEAANMYWRNEAGGRAVYSYGHHYTIAKITDSGKLLFNNRHYSATTAHHAAEVRHANPGYKIVYCTDPNGTPSENFKAYIQQIKEAARKLEKARKPEIYLDIIADIYSTAKAYAEAVAVPMDKDIIKLCTASDSAKAVKLYEARTEARAKRAKAKAEAEARRTAEEAYNSKEFQKAVKDWEAGSAYIPTYHKAFNFNTPLRIEDKKGYKVIKTAKGVTITLGQALEFARKFEAVQPGDKIDYYTVTRKDKEVTQIGCHTFRTAYLEAFKQMILKIA